MSNIICIHLSTGENIIGEKVREYNILELKNPFIIIYAREQGMIGFDRWMYYIKDETININGNHIVATYEPKPNLIETYKKFLQDIEQMGPEELSFSDDPPGLLEEGEGEEEQQIDEDGDVIPPKSMLN